VLVSIVLYKDYNGTLEESFNNFEKKIGLYTESDTTTYDIPPFYITPMEIDSTWILPRIEPDSIEPDSTERRV
jgi:hypothetical protein